jgi:hypothetical protein
MKKNSHDQLPSTLGEGENITVKGTRKYFLMLVKPKQNQNRGFYGYVMGP